MLPAYQKESYKRVVTTQGCVRGKGHLNYLYMAPILNYTNYCVFELGTHLLHPLER